MEQLIQNRDFNRAKKFAEEHVDDGILTPTEKKQMLRLYNDLTLENSTYAHEQMLSIYELASKGYSSERTSKVAKREADYRKKCYEVSIICFLLGIIMCFSMQYISDEHYNDNRLAMIIMPIVMFYVSIHSLLLTTNC